MLEKLFNEIRKIMFYDEYILTEIMNFFYDNTKNKIDYEKSNINAHNSDDLSFLINIEDELFKNFFIQNTEFKSINFLKIDSLVNSKSGISRYDNLYNFGKSNYIIYKWTFKQCITHVTKEMEQKPFNLNYYCWNNKYHWINDGSSHHFATAQFIATNKKITNFINCNITTFEINLDVAQSLLKKYEMFIIHMYNYRFLEELLVNDICNVIELNNNYMILLKKKRVKNKLYLKFLKNMGKDYVLYFNDYLKDRIGMK